MNYKTLITIVFFLFSTGLYAAEYSRSDLSITSLKGMAVSRPANLNAVDYIRLYTNSGSWGSSNCRQDAADLSKADTHLVSMLLSALAQKQSVILSIDDSLKPIDNTCQVVAIEVNI
jgi:hypothetical protein